jgi:hypothetical protein
MRRKVRCTSRRARNFPLDVARQTAGEAPDRPRPMQEILAKYNPGLNAQEFTLGGAAKFIAAGSDIVFEIHYTTSGRPETDRSKVGIVFAAGPPQQRYVTTTGINSNRFVIPAHASNYEVKAETTLQADAQLALRQSRFAGRRRLDEHGDHSLTRSGHLGYRSSVCARGLSIRQDYARSRSWAVRRQFDEMPIPLMSAARNPEVCDD